LKKIFSLSLFTAQREYFLLRRRGFPHPWFGIKRGNGGGERGGEHYILRTKGVKEKFSSVLQEKKKGGGREPSSLSSLTVEEKEESRGKTKIFLHRASKGGKVEAALSFLPSLFLGVKWGEEKGENEGK